MTASAHTEIHSERNKTSWYWEPLLRVSTYGRVADLPAPVIQKWTA